MHKKIKEAFQSLLSSYENISIEDIKVYEDEFKRYRDSDITKRSPYLPDKFGRYVMKKKFGLGTDDFILCWTAWEVARNCFNTIHFDKRHVCKFCFGNLGGCVDKSLDVTAHNIHVSETPAELLGNIKERVIVIKKWLKEHGYESAE